MSCHLLASKNWVMVIFWLYFLGGISVEITKRAISLDITIDIKGNLVLVLVHTTIDTGKFGIPSALP